MDYERERRRQKRYREAMRNRIIAAVLLAGIILGAIFIIKGCKKDDAPADDAQNTNQPVDNVGDTTTPDNVIVDDELLTLVNPWNPLPDDWTVDLVDANMQDLTSAQESTETQKWLMANSWRYGFIHRYPNGKTDITGIIYEPWHYRYVGKDAAQEIFNRDITLEEYLGKTEH